MPISKITISKQIAMLGFGFLGKVEDRHLLPREKLYLDLGQNKPILKIRSFGKKYNRQIFKIPQFFAGTPSFSTVC